MTIREELNVLSLTLQNVTTINFVIIMVYEQEHIRLILHHMVRVEELYS